MISDGLLNDSTYRNSHPIPALVHSTAQPCSSCSNELLSKELVDANQKSTDMLQGRLSWLSEVPFRTMETRTSARGDPLVRSGRRVQPSRFVGTPSTLSEQHHRASGFCQLVSAELVIEALLPPLTAVSFSPPAGNPCFPQPWRHITCAVRRVVKMWVPVVSSSQPPCMPPCSEGRGTNWGSATNCSSSSSAPCAQPSLPPPCPIVNVQGICFVRTRVVGQEVSSAEKVSALLLLLQ